MKKISLFIIAFIIMLTLFSCGSGICTEKKDTGDGTYQIIEYKNKVHTKTSNYDKNKKLNSIWFYDKNGNCIRSEVYESGKLFSYTVCEFDKKGCRISETHYLANGKIDYHSESKNDEIVLFETYSDGKLEMKSVYERKDGTTYRTDTDSDKNIICKAVITKNSADETYYDKSGNAIYVDKFNSSGDLIGRYDMQGNLIEK